MEQEEYIKGIGDYIAAVRRRRGIVLAIFLVVSWLALIAAVALPPVYKSTAKVLVEQQSIPANLVRTTVTIYAAQTIQIISARIKSTPKLRDFVEKYGLFEKELESQNIYSVVGAFREKINLNVVSARKFGGSSKAAFSFALSFSSESPQTAQFVTSKLVSLFLAENAQIRSKQSSETANFLGQEAKKMVDQVVQLEENLAKFKEKYGDNLPEQSQNYRSSIESLSQEISDLNRQILTLSNRKFLLESDLAKLSPNIATYSGTDGAIPAPDSATRLQQLKSQIAINALRYSETHPDMIKMRRAIKLLEKKVSTTNAELEQEIGESSANVGLESKQVSAAPTNPVYVQLISQLRATESELGILRGAAQDKQNRVIRLRNKLTEAPEIERQYNELNRDYRGILKQYNEIKAKQRVSDMARAMELDNKGERFTLLEPALVPRKPVKPPRLLILIGGLICGLGMGIGVVVLLELLDTSIRGIPSLEAVTGAPPLAVIPFIETSEDKQIRMSNRVKLLASVGVVIVAATLNIHIFVVPLDDAWFFVVERLTEGLG